MKGVIFIGLQASGKSTFFMKRFSKTHLRLSMDMLKTRFRENILLTACLEAKQPCVIDNTNPTKADRIKYIKSFKDYRFEVIGYYFNSNLNECLVRNSLRTGKELVPEIGVRAIHKKLEIPEYSEGFDYLFHVSIHGDDFLIKELADEF